MRGKWEERCHQTRADGALMGRGCAFRGGGRVERMRGGGINMTTSHRARDYRGDGKSNGDGDGDRECCAPPSWNLAATALVLAAEAAASLIADNARGCTGDFSKKKIFSNTFFLSANL